MRYVLVSALLLCVASTASAQLYGAVLPSGRAVAVGRPATAFATIVNAGTKTATGCGIAPATSLPASFTYQTTDPATNAPTGTADTPVDIPSGRSQSFVFALTASTGTDADVLLRFSCESGEAAPIVPGLNTFDFVACAGTAPDYVVAVATPSHDGILTIPGPGGSEAFSVAIMNIGAGSTSQACAHFTGVGLHRLPVRTSYRLSAESSAPVSATICQTDSSGQCLGAPAQSVGITDQAGVVATHSVFVSASGTVPLAPAANRVGVRIEEWATYHNAVCSFCPFTFDERADVRPAGSVAVRTAE